MKKLLVCLAAVMALTSCNMQILDFELKFNKAYMKWPDGTMKVVNVKKWCDYCNSDAVQIIADDGTVYLSHYANVYLTYEKDKD